MGARVIFITGKGGTGKSSIASALAREEAQRHRSVLLLRMPDSADAEAGPQRGGGQVAEAPPLFRERTLDSRRDFEAFLTRVLGLETIARRLGRSRTFAAVAAAAPGLHDLVALGTILAAAKQERGTVLVDAPSTGHSVPMLAAPSRVLDLSTVGPVAREAVQMRRVLADPAAFTVLVVATPEELPILEARSLRRQVAEAGVADARVVVNAVWPACVSENEGNAIAAQAPASSAALHWRRHQRQRRLIGDLEEDIGACPRVGFAFAEAHLPRDDIASLLDLLQTGKS